MLESSPEITSPQITSSPLVLLSRSISFSCGLRLNHPNWDATTNERIFGRAARPHGAEFHLHVALSGDISINDGMIVNLVEVKPQLAHAISEIEDKFLDVDVAHFRHNRPTTENIALFLWHRLPTSIGHGQLYRLLLDQSGGIGVEIQANQATCIMKVSRSYEFAAAHRLFTPNLSEEENWQRFDKCSNAAGHGHNFRLRVWIEGTPDGETGFIILPRALDSIVNEEVYERFDHKHLNEDCPEFKGTGLVPTSENLALVIFGLLQTRLKQEGHKLAKIGLQETQKNYFEVEA